MQIYRQYRCDYGHRWSIERTQGDPERPEDLRCGEGHDAIACSEEEPSDEVQLLFRPAARIVDKVKGQTALEGRYWLVLLDRAGEILCRSDSHYPWEEIMKLATLFRGKSSATALEWWQRKSP
jgi:hypothetical protein